VQYQAATRGNSGGNCRVDMATKPKPRTFETTVKQRSQSGCGLVRALQTAIQFDYALFLNSRTLVW
jgi:hypothetical protein